MTKTNKITVSELVCAAIDDFLTVEPNSKVEDNQKLSELGDQEDLELLFIYIEISLDVKICAQDYDKIVTVKDLIDYVNVSLSEQHKV